MDGLYLRIKTGGQADYPPSNLSISLEDSPLPEVKISTNDRIFTLSRICLLSKDQRVNIHTESRYAFGRTVLETKGASHLCWNLLPTWTTNLRTF